MVIMEYGRIVLFVAVHQYATVLRGFLILLVSRKNIWVLENFFSEADRGFLIGRKLILQWGRQRWRHYRSGFGAFEDRWRSVPWSVSEVMVKLINC